MSSKGGRLEHETGLKANNPDSKCKSRQLKGTRELPNLRSRVSFEAFLEAETEAGRGRTR